MAGWIKLHRQMLEWEWYDDMNTKCLFLHLLLKANHKPTTYRGVPIARGQHLTSLDKLSKDTGLTVSQVRTSIKKLVSTGEITDGSQAGGRMVTVIGYDAYQANDKDIDSPMTSESQDDSNKQECNNNKNEKKRSKAVKPAIPYDQIQEAYNEALPTLTGCRIMSKKIRSNIQKIWNADERHQDVDFFRRYFTALNSLTSRMSFWEGSNDGKKYGNIELLTREETFVRSVNELLELKG